MEGTIASTGNTVQARASYRPADIMWGYTFEPMVSVNTTLSRQGRVATLDFTKLHEIKPGTLRPEDDPRTKRSE